MDETALFPLPGVYFKLDRGHRRDEDPRMSLPCYKNPLQICNSVQGLCLSLYYHFWFQVRHAENLGINTPDITPGKIWTSRKSVVCLFFFLLGPLECWSCKSNCHHRTWADRATVGAMSWEEHSSGNVMSCWRLSADQRESKKLLGASLRRPKGFLGFCS